MAVQRINPTLTPRLAAILPLLTQHGQDHWKRLAAAGWKMLVINQRRGFCRYFEKVVTVPAWAFNPSKDDGYRAWYLGHEIAHAVAGPAAKHGPDFMEQLKLIVPAAWVHYEYGYKPRNAMAAGVPMADGTVPVKAPPAARSPSLHPQSVINAKNHYLRTCLGVWLTYDRGRKAWLVRDKDRPYIWMSSEQFARIDAVNLEILLRGHVNQVRGH